MDTDKLITELMKMDNLSIKKIIFAMLLKKKINFVDIADSYTRLLELENEDNKDKLAEASTCIIQYFIEDIAIEDRKQRSLYFLNEIGNFFKMEETNRKNNYQKDIAKELSYYYRNMNR